MLLLSAREIFEALPMPQAIEALEAGLPREFGQKQHQLPRQVLTMGTSSESPQVLTLCAALNSPKYACVKVSSLTPTNRKKNLPLIHGLVALLDYSNGEVVALMEGSSLTCLRTGAMTGLATKFLALQDAEDLAVIGAGAQARFQIDAVFAVRAIRTVRITSRSPKSAKDLGAWLRDRYDASVIVGGDPDTLASESDIVCCATSNMSSTPVVSHEALRPGTHVNSIGGVDENSCEVDPRVAFSAKTVVDGRAAAIAEAYEVIEGLRQGYLMPEQLIELAAIVAGEARGRETPDDITFFRSVGVALADAIVAIAIYESARKGPQKSSFNFETL